jgi:alginate O-acetyltransferase complex protein AlgI
MSYTIDLYRRKIPVCTDPIKFFLFVGFFAQLVAGPIVRAAEFLPQLHNPIRLTRVNAVMGAQVFLLGLFQKVVVADNVAILVDPVFLEPALYDAPTLWLALAAYGLQIFCDFSGYSLMAIGVARIIGFTLPENFRAPYISRSITEFWRRWHISLSTWLRDYLYISLGGNRRGSRRTEINLMTTMLLGGLWHGSAWNFVLWGGLHGLGLVLHKHWSGRVRMNERFSGASRTAYSVVAWAITLLFVLLLWVPFRCADFATTLIYLTGLVSLGDGVRFLHTPTMVLLAVMTAWHAAHLGRASLIKTMPTTHPLELRPLLVIGLLLLAVLLFAPTGASPFIYFQF